MNVLFHDGALSLQIVYEDSMNANITEHVFFRLESISHFFIKSFHSLYHHTPRYLDYIDIYLILTHIKTILIQDMLSLFRRKICTARKRVAEQKFAGQRLLPGH